MLRRAACAASRSRRFARSPRSFRRSTRHWRSSSTRPRRSACTSTSSCGRDSTSSVRDRTPRARGTAPSSAASTSRACTRRTRRTSGAGRDHISGGQALDLPQALPVADGVARARVDAGLGAASPASPRAPRRSERRDAPTPARDGVVGRARPRRRAARAGLDGRRRCRPDPCRCGRGRRGDHERSQDLRGYTGVVNRAVTIAGLSACGAPVPLSRSCSRPRRAQERTTASPLRALTRRRCRYDDDPRRRRLRRPLRRPRPLLTRRRAAATEADRRGRDDRWHARRRPDRCRGPEVVRDRFARRLALVGGPGPGSWSPRRSSGQRPRSTRP